MKFNLYKLNILISDMTILDIEHSQIIRLSLVSLFTKAARMLDICAVLCIPKTIGRNISWTAKWHGATRNAIVRVGAVALSLTVQFFIACCRLEDLDCGEQNLLLKCHVVLLIQISNIHFPILQHKSYAECTNKIMKHSVYSVYTQKNRLVRNWNSFQIETAWYVTVNYVRYKNLYLSYCY